MDALPDTLCYLNGEFKPLNQAQVSVMDRGFLYGDAAYEAIPVYRRRLFRFDEHLARLSRSLSKLRITADVDPAAWRERLRHLIDLHPADDQLVYLQVSRGVALRSHVPPEGIVPTVFATTSALPAPTPQQRHEGLDCISARDFRWEHADIKCTSLVGNVLARMISADEGADETILFRDGAPGGPWLTEASSSNVWIVHEGALLGPPRSEWLLEGIRAELLQELCDDCGIAFNRRPISEADVRAADEILLSAASKEVIAVTRLDGEEVGHGALRGRPGPVYSRLYEAYQRAKQTSSERP